MQLLTRVQPQSLGPEVSQLSLFYRSPPARGEWPPGYPLIPRATHRPRGTGAGYLGAAEAGGGGTGRRRGRATRRRAPGRVALGTASNVYGQGRALVSCTGKAAVRSGLV